MQENTVKWIFEIDSDLDCRFRDSIGKKLGARRGNIKQALEEAIEDWIKK